MAALGFCTVSAPPSCSRPHQRRRRSSAAAIRVEVSFVSSVEAKRIVAEEGFTVVDVRGRTQFKRAHIKSCKYVPLFVENQDNDFGTIVKRTVHNNFSGLLFWSPFTKPNPDFVPSVKEQFSPDTANKIDGQGFQNIYCITSGLQSVKPGTFESVGTTELQNAGKAGLVTVQGKISAILGTVLVCAFLFVTFFPEQAKKLLEMSPIACGVINMKCL